MSAQCRYIFRFWGLRNCVGQPFFGLQDYDKTKYMSFETIKIENVLELPGFVIVGVLERRDKKAGGVQIVLSAHTPPRYWTQFVFT